MPALSDPPPRRRVRRALRFLPGALLLLPPALHVASLAGTVTAHGNFLFGRLDLVFLVLTLIWTAMAAAVLTRPAVAGRLLVLSVAVLLPLAGLEAWLASRAPSGGLPWPPMKRVSVAGDSMPGVTGEIRFSVSSFGIRAREADPGKADHAILCVGGSTTECLYVTDERSWPWRLGELLSKERGENVFVGNAGRSGHTTGNHEFLLRHYRHVDAFDQVILLAGINDLGTFLRGTEAERDRLVPEETLWSAPEEWKERRVWYRRSHLFRRLFPENREEARDDSKSEALETVEQDAAGIWYEEQRRARLKALAKETRTEPPADFDDFLSRYRERLRRIHALCRERGQSLLLVTQPVLWRADLPEEFEARLWAYTPDGAWTPGALAGMMDRVNRSTLEVAAEEQIPVVDLAARLSGDEHFFYDDCHFNLAGSERVAEILFERLKAR